MKMMKVWLPHTPMVIFRGDKRVYIDNLGVERDLSELPKNWDYGEDYTDILVGDTQAENKFLIERQLNKLKKLLDMIRK